MKSRNKKRVMLISCAIILLCSCIIVGMSYALFSDSVSVKNHLKAGTLDVTLKRTKLEYSVLNTDGELEVTTVDEDLDLTGSSDKNVFGIDSTAIRIVPGSYFDATLEIANQGNTAFTYDVSVQLTRGYEKSKLAEQLKVTVYDAKGDEVDSQMLSALTNGLRIDTGKIKVGGDAQTFRVRVDFVDDRDYNKGLTEDDERMNNNEAQDQTAVFDLVVSAIQATTKSN